MPKHADTLEVALKDRYRIDHEIGSGGMATVYLAQDLKHDRQVAIKVLRPEIAAELGVERFLREISIASKLSHPHIVPVYDSGQVDGFVYFTMPYIEGKSLRWRLNREPRLTLDEVVRIIREIAAALSYAHQQGVVHRDIKPENILFSGGVAVVADFGIARAISAAGGGGATTSGFGLGTLGYMSPEQAAGGQDLDGRSDIYGIGCVLHEMLLGKPPGRWLDGTTLDTGRIADAAPEDRTQLDNVPDWVERILVATLAQSRERRFASADELLAALGSVGTVTGPAALPGGSRRRHRRRWYMIAALGALAAVVAATMIVRSRSAPAMDPDVIAVAPFDVLDPQLATWSEGLIDLLSAALDGAGPLRAVPPSVAVKGWKGRADAVSARSMGSSLGAGLVLYGRVVGAGADSARAFATLFDVAANRTIAEFDLRDRADRIDRLADSLAVRLMGELSRTRGLSGWRLASLGSSSPAALKAFLNGERHYRSFNLDSAEAYYARALELDSGFALAYSRRATVGGWTLDFDPNFTPSLLRAGQLNHGLARRESLLIVADSIFGALTQFIGDSTSWTQLRRFFTTLEYATRQYPTDPQVWYELGEARYHYGSVVGIGDQQAFDAFTRAVALDSAFVPAYRHLVELTLLLRGRDAARRVTELYAARSDSSLFRDAALVIASLLDPERARDPSTQQSLEALSPEGLFQAWYDIKWWIDSAETSRRVADAWMTMTDSGFGRQSLALAFAYRGHLRDAYTLIGEREPALFAVLALLGGIPREEARAQFGAWLEARDGFGILHGHRWWAADGDTTSLKRAVSYWDSVTATMTPQNVPRLEHIVRTSRAYLALARRDTLAALRQLEALPVWPDRYYSYYEQLTRGQLLARLGRDREAADVLDHLPFGRQWSPPADAIVAELERGRVHERLGDRETAIRAYSVVVDAWGTADPELLPLVEEARTALARLVGEGTAERSGH